MEASEVSRQIYRRLVDLSPGSPPAVRLWTDEVMGPGDAAATLVLNHPGAWRALLVPPDNLTSAEAYLYDDVDVEGDMVAMMEFLASLEETSHRYAQLARLVGLALKLPADFRRSNPQRPFTGSGALHSLRRDEKAVTFHYDTGNEFFKVFLDPQLVYSCADFLNPGENLAAAQERKLDLICRKLELAHGQRFLDVGCGWGALVVHAASRYGVQATGVTLSEPQAAVAEIRAKEAGVEDLVTIVRGDYRALDGTFEAIASVGMFEHVGRSQLSDYFRLLLRRLAPGGQLLNHGIVARRRSSLRRPTFISTYVFPDSQLLPVAEVVRDAERAGFELRDAESLRASYALTLRHWVANLEANAERAIDLVGDRIYRIWRLYMAGSVLAFERAHLSVFQLLLADPRRPWAFGRRRLLAADDS